MFLFPARVPVAAAALALERARDPGGAEPYRDRAVAVGSQHLRRSAA
jgi:hypothetical protein